RRRRHQGRATRHGRPAAHMGRQAARRRLGLEELEPQQEMRHRRPPHRRRPRAAARAARVSDVLVLNTRPSTLARWGLDYKSLHARHPKLVVLHVSGYGLGGPASDRPGFGTLAEAMSGFAHVCGQADGPPTLPPFMLADGVAAQSATYAVMTVLYHRDVHGAGGQLVDVSLIEPLARLIEQATLAYDQLGRIQGRSGNRADASAPRNAYRTADDRWISISSASSSVAARLYRAIDRPDLAARPEYVDPIPRQARADEIDALVTEWIRAHTLDQAMKVFLSEDVAAAPIYDAQQLLADEHLRARGTFVAVDDPDLGAMTVQAPVARLSVTPGRIEHLGARWARTTRPCTAICSVWTTCRIPATATRPATARRRCMR